jgi:hypothetical protein
MAVRCKPSSNSFQLFKTDIYQFDVKPHPHVEGRSGDKIKRHSERIQFRFLGIAHGLRAIL